MSDKPNDIARSRLERMKDASNLQATAHATLRDIYKAWNFWLTLAALIPTATLLMFPLVSDDFITRSLHITPDAFKITNAVVALFAFIAVLVQLVWKPDSLSAAHARAVAHYTNAKFDIRRLLEREAPAVRDIEIVEEKYLDTRDLPPIEEKRFLPLKQWHLQKIQTSKELESDPWQRSGRRANSNRPRRSVEDKGI
jgi:hypothetical protein